MIDYYSFSKKESRFVHVKNRTLQLGLKPSVEYWSALGYDTFILKENVPSYILNVSQTYNAYDYHNQQQNDQRTEIEFIF